MVAVFREVKRVLRPDGVLWLNIGDSYASGGGIDPYRRTTSNKLMPQQGRAPVPSGCKPKDLIGIPWMLAFALRADGWWLRSDVVWAKGRDGDTEDAGPGNCMPESVTDRPTRSHEYVFLLSKSSDYFYDADAIKEQAIAIGDTRHLRTDKTQTYGRIGGDDSRKRTGNPQASTRNARSVWLINTTAYPGAHYAVFPERLVERCILAGSSPQACEHCGAPWERVVEREGYNGAGRATDTYTGKAYSAPQSAPRGPKSNFGESKSDTLGWQPTCQCDNTGAGQCVVLDPFFGSGTTGRVALRHGRACIGIELNAAYLEQIEQRTNGVQTSMAGVLC